MKKFVQSLELRWSDLLLLIGAGSFAFFIGFSQTYMGELNPSNLPAPMWLVILIGLVMLGSLIGYLYLELVVRKVKFNIYILFAFLTLMLINTIVILAASRSNYLSVVVRSKIDEFTPPGEIGKAYPLVVSISLTHKMFFIFELMGTLLFMYCMFFVFSKRIKNLKFIEYLGYIVFGIGIFLAIYSYATESHKYVSFISEFLVGKLKGIPQENDVSVYTVTSFFSHRNPLGMTYMLCILFTFINHAYHKYWWHYLLTAFFFINLIFTFNKTGLLLSVLMILIYLVYRLIVTFKDHKKRNTITLICVGSVLLIALVVIGLPYLTKGKVFGKVYEIIDSLSGEGKTLKYREYIWDNTYSLLEGGNWIWGRGFGILNMLVRPMNIMSHGEDVISTHSGYLNNLAEGGIIFLIAYLVLIGYVSYAAYKAFKKERDLTITIYLGVLLFLLYSFVETNHYLAYIFMFPIFVLYHKDQEQA